MRRPRCARAIRAADARRVLHRRRRLEGAWSTRRRAPTALTRARSDSRRRTAHERFDAPSAPISRRRRSARARCAAAWDGDVAWSFRHSPGGRSSRSIVLVDLPRRRAVRAVGRAAQSVRPRARSTCPTRSRRRPGSPAARQRYLLGTDDQGRDVLSAIMFGARISLAGRRSRRWRSPSCWACRSGSSRATSGGKLDAFIMRVADVQLSFPAILIALLIDGVARAVLPRDVARRRRALRAGPRDRARPTGCNTRARCAARRWSRRARSTCRPRA